MLLQFRLVRQQLVCAARYSRSSLIFSCAAYAQQVPPTPSARTNVRQSATRCWDRTAGRSPAPVDMIDQATSSRPAAGISRSSTPLSPSLLMICNASHGPPKLRVPSTRTAEKSTSTHRCGGRSKSSACPAAFGERAASRIPKRPASSRSPRCKQPLAAAVPGQCEHS